MSDIASTQLSRPVQAPPVRQSVKNWEGSTEPKAEKAASRGPAVTLSGNLAKNAPPPQTPPVQQPTAAAGQHINHVI